MLGYTIATGARMGLPFADILETGLVMNPSSTHEKTVYFTEDVIERP